MMRKWTKYVHNKYARAKQCAYFLNKD